MQLLRSCSFIRRLLKWPLCCAALFCSFKCQGLQKSRSHSVIYIFGGRALKFNKQTIKRQCTGRTESFLNDLFSALVIDRPTDRLPERMAQSNRVAVGAYVRKGRDNNCAPRRNFHHHPAPEGQCDKSHEPSSWPEEERSHRSPTR